MLALVLLATAKFTDPLIHHDHGVGAFGKPFQPTEFGDTHGRIFTDPRLLSTADVKAPQLPPKLLNEMHKAKLAEESAEDTIRKDDQHMEDLQKKIDMDADDEARKEENMEDKFAQRLNDDDSAFEKAMDRAERKNRETGDALVKDFEDKMESALNHPGRSSFLQTADKAADKDKAAAEEAQLVATVKAQAEAAAKTEIGMKMRQIMQQSAEERYGEKQRIMEDRDEEHKQLAEIRTGLARTKERMKEYTGSIDSRRSAVMKKLDETDKKFEQKLAGEEDKLESHTKATEKRLHNQYEADRKRFQERERETEDIMEGVFHPGSFIETASNLRSGD